MKYCVTFKTFTSIFAPSSKVFTISFKALLKRVICFFNEGFSKGEDKTGKLYALSALLEASHISQIVLDI